MLHLGHDVCWDIAEPRRTRFPRPGTFARVSLFDRRPAGVSRGCLLAKRSQEGLCVLRLRTIHRTNCQGDLGFFPPRRDLSAVMSRIGQPLSRWSDKSKRSDAVRVLDRRCQRQSGTGRVRNDIDLFDPQMVCGGDDIGGIVPPAAREAPAGGRAARVKDRERARVCEPSHISQVGGLTTRATGKDEGGRSASTAKDLDRQRSAVIANDEFHPGRVSAEGTEPHLAPSCRDPRASACHDHPARIRHR